MANYNVYKGKDADRWAVKKQGADRVSDFAGIQREAEQRAKELAAHSGGGEVRIHGRDGKIRDSDTVPPARDPNPPRDRRH
jgi:uncharacterized protein YdaT